MISESSTDAELVDCVMAGDSSVYGKLMQRYEARLHRYVVYLIHDDAMARDVVQETFIKAYHNLRSYNHTYKFSSWIYRIAHNEAMNMVRRHRREVALDDDIESTFDSSIMHDIDQEILSNNLSGCLAKLDERGREVLMLHYYEHMKYEDIADVLHSPSSTIGVWIARAKKRLKQICEQQGVRR